MHRRISGSCLLLILSILPAVSQKKSAQDRARIQSQKQEAPLTFQVPVDVVIVSVSVLDRQGLPVTDLTVGDFKVFDDGRIQAIQTFSREGIDTVPEAPVQEPLVRAAKGPPVAPASQSVGRPRYFCFFVDDLIQPSIEWYQPAFEAVRSFITRDLLPGDQIAVTAASGAGTGSFSGDADVLMTRVDDLEKRLNRRPLSLPACPRLSDMQAVRIDSQIVRPDAPEYSDDEAVRVAVADLLGCDPEIRTIYDMSGRAAAIKEARIRIPRIARQHIHEKEYRIGQLLASLRQWAASMRFYEGRKSIVVISGGFYAPETQYSLQAVIEKALRSGVAINTLDVRGVYTTNISAAESMHSDNETLAQREALFRASLRAQEEPLAQMASDTGGLFAHGNNDLHLGLKRIAERQTSTYVLSYAAPNLKNDGSFHKIRLDVARPGLQMTYRQGYFAPKEEVSFVRRKREDILEALRAPGDLNTLPVRLSYSSFQVDSSHYQLRVQIQVDIQAIKFAEQESRHCNLIHILTVASDQQGKVVDGMERAIDFKLTDASYRNMLEYGLYSEAEINLPPGRFRLLAVARESNQGKMGSQSRTIAVP